jgi:hypothetical protein
MTQTPLSGGEAALIGLVMLAVVAFEATEAVVRHIDTTAHEGSHALISPLPGRAVQSVKIGRTVTGRPNLFPGFPHCHVRTCATAGLLLVSGVRTIIEHGLDAGGAGIHRNATGVPKPLWSLLWLAGSLVAVAVGGRMLVMGPG